MLNNIKFDKISREEFMRLIQMYFERLYDTKVVIRGKYTPYLSLPMELVKKYDMVNKKFAVKVVEDSVIYEENNRNGYELKDFGGRKWTSYYIKFPLKVNSNMHVKIIVENEKPLRFIVILPR